MTDTTRRPTREEAIRSAGRVLAQAYATADAMPPAELARACWHPGSRFSVAELEDQIRADRGLEPLNRRGDAPTP